MTATAKNFRVNGLVQGVGFRPTVYRIAAALNLTGYVWNDAAGVGVHLEGDPEALAAFPETLIREKPPLARIDVITPEDAPFEGCEAFTITESRSEGPVVTAITADAATCRACLEDVFTAGNRRHRYAFTNCTHCGPRFTITKSLPYDRPQTSMRVFPMCPACLKEYEDPLDRRFHAQPNACPVCGPQLTLLSISGETIPGDPVRETVRLLKAGKTVAVKGLGGFHLAVIANDAAAVARLRDRKGRSEKPLAVMSANLASAATFAQVNDAERELMLSPAHPIVLLKKRPDAPAWPGVADGLTEIGVMLPYTPLHALLFHALAGEPEGTAWLEDAVIPEALVMTSANPGGEPLVIDNDEAMRRLAHIADAVLLHNREILLRNDDSVVRVAEEGPLWVRRARGAVPESIVMPDVPGMDEASRPSVLAYGPWMKETLCQTRGGEAFLSQHIGDLENRTVVHAMKEGAEHLARILAKAPDAFACDAHPDFASTHEAERRAAESGLPLVKVPHHAAHVAAVAAEAGMTGRVLGLALDGVGLGPDGTPWGGELLALEPDHFTRLGHLAPLALPGGDRAARECWRVGAALMDAVGLADRIGEVFPETPEARQIPKLINIERLSPRTTSLGRRFDAVSAVLGFVTVQQDEAWAAMRLEAEAQKAADAMGLTDFGAFPYWPDAWQIHADGVLDMTTLDRRLVEGRLAGEDPAKLALLWQTTLTHALADWAVKLCGNDPAGARIVLSGGCVVNRTLADGLPRLMRLRGIDAVLPHRAPPGDGGVALGQAWIALRALALDRTDYDFKA